MPSLQDTDNAQPRPGNWHRNQNRTTLGDTTNIAAPPKPPVPATSQAKSKLKAFQFIPGQPKVARETPEPKTNGAPVDSSRPVDRTTKQHNANSSSASQHAARPASPVRMADSTKTPQLPHAHTFPSTPGARLSLEELIGNVEDNPRPEPREESPEEHVGWIPNSSSTQLTPNRKRKRARSSSPSCPNTSSQRAEASAFFAGSAEKRTPEADPAADLWQRYGIGKDSGDAMKLPDLNGMAFQGSPRAFETPVKASGLRRWASTGNDWPSSRSKKRRSNMTAKVDVWQNGQADSGGRSKVATMVEKIQESLATQKLAKAVPAITGDEPSSSSPLPDTGGEFGSAHQPMNEPVPKLDLTNATSVPRMGPPPARPQGSSRLQPLSANNAASARDAQYSFNNGQDTVVPAPLHLQSKAPLPAFRRPSIRRTPSDSTKQPSPKPQAPAQALPSAPAPLPALLEDLDEFGDDLDFSTEDLDELMSQPLQNRSLHDIPPHPNPPPQPSQQQFGGILIDNDEDDEFACDDLDETSFMEAELQATQTHRASRPLSK